MEQLERGVDFREVNVLVHLLALENSRTCENVDLRYM